VVDFKLTYFVSNRPSDFLEAKLHFGVSKPPVDAEVDFAENPFKQESDTSVPVHSMETI
jgi:hypothetical protein